MKTISESIKRKGFGVIIACVVVAFLIIIVFIGSAAIIGDHKGAGDTGEMISNTSAPGATGGTNPGKTYPDDSTPIAVPNGPCGQKIVQIASNEVGAIEVGKNEGPQNSPTHHGITDDYKNHKMRGAPWCSFFASWVLRQAGDSIPVTPKAANVYVWYNTRKQAFTKASVLAGKNTPQPGDIFVKKLTPVGDGHIGIIESYSNGILHTIEGNSGDMVKRGTRNIKDNDVQGFGRPKCQ